MSSSNSLPHHPRIAIIGGGVIGASVAYHLAQLNHRATIFEQCQIACAASGKSGGFLAKDWCDDSPLRHLARPSFDMHANYSNILDADLSYRTLDAYSISLVSNNSPTASYQSRSKSKSKSLQWVDGQVQIVGRPNSIGNQQTCAQLLPYKLVQAFVDQAQKLVNTNVIIARVNNVKKHDNGKEWQIIIVDEHGTESTQLFDIVVICMGPWTIQAKKWFPELPPIMAHKAASLVVKAHVPATALFTEFVNSKGEARTPEAYPRSDEVYLCQSAITEDLPDDPSQIIIDQQDVASLTEFGKAINQQIADALNDERQVISQACNLPISPDGLPLIGEIAGTNRSVFVAAGHSCWGILNSPATGKAIAQLITSGTSSIKIDDFSPNRFVEK